MRLAALVLVAAVAAAPLPAQDTTFRAGLFPRTPSIPGPHPTAYADFNGALRFSVSGGLGSLIGITANRATCTFGSNNSLQVTGTCSGVRNASGQGAGKLNAAGIREVCRSITTGAQCWGANPVVTDTGGGVGALIGLEADVILQNPTSNYTNPVPIGIKAVMGGSGSGPGAVG